MDCKLAERQLADLERSISRAASFVRRPPPAAPALAAAPAPAPAPAPVVSTTARGVSDREIRFGIAAPFSGAARELGRQMKLGIDTAFNQINEAGGVDGRMLRLIAADDGYEPTRTAEAMKQLYEKEQVFGIIGNVGTPTAAVAVPYALERKLLFFGAFTGANLLRDPPDRYVFNYRASYAEETDAVVRYLVKLRAAAPSADRRFRPDRNIIRQFQSPALRRHFVRSAPTTARYCVLTTSETLWMWTRRSIQLRRRSCQSGQSSWCQLIAPPQSSSRRSRPLSWHDFQQRVVRGQHRHSPMN